jgi:hypothetical protein
MDDVTICNLALARLGDSRIVTMNDSKPEAEYCTLFYGATRDEVLRGHPWNFATTRAALSLSWVALTGTAFANNGSGLIRATKTAHGLATGDRIHVKNVVGVEANGTWNITRIDADTFDLIGSTFAGAHTSGTGSFLKAPLFGWDYLYTLPSNFLRLLQLNAYEAEEPTTRWEVEGRLLLTNEEEGNIKYVYQVTDENLFDALFVEAFSLKLATKLAKPLTGSSQMAEGFLTEYARITAPLARRIDASESHPTVKPAWVDSPLVNSRFGSDIG